MPASEATNGVWTRARPWVLGLTEAAIAFAMLPETPTFPSIWGHEQPPAATLAFAAIGVVDTATPTRARPAEIYFPPAHPTHRVRLGASGAPRRELRPHEWGRIEPLAIGIATPHESCSAENGAFVGRTLSKFRVLHPNEARSHELVLVLGRGARDQHLALCLDAFAAYEFTHVDLMGRVRVPFPWLFPLSRYTRAHFPAVSVLHAPTSGLRCDPADAARCTEGGTLRLSALLALARLP